MKPYFSILAALLLSVGVSTLQAQIITIPDTIFKQILITTPGIDVNNDGEIQLMEAFNYNNVINCLGIPLITDLTGIEAFVSLQFLYCEGTQITSLDLTNCSSLVRLQCQSTALTSLDLSNNGNLVYLSAQDNDLVNLNIANGNGTNMTYLRTLNNPNLNCIKVDDPTYSYANWGSGNFAVDTTTTSFNLDCSGIVSTKAITTKEKIEVYPNPTQKSVTIDLGTIYSSVNITVLNAIGQDLQSNTYNNTQLLDLDVQGLPGWYFIRIETKKGSSTLKVLKQ